MIIEKINSRAKLWASLIIYNERTLEDVPENLRYQVEVSVCAKKILFSRLPYKAACGISPVAEAYPNDISTGFCAITKDNKTNVDNYIIDEKKPWYIEEVDMNYLDEIIE